MRKFAFIENAKREIAKAKKKLKKKKKEKEDINWKTYNEINQQYTQPEYPYWNIVNDQPGGTGDSSYTTFSSSSPEFSTTLTSDNTGEIPL